MDLNLKSTKSQSQVRFLGEPKRGPNRKGISARSQRPRRSRDQSRPEERSLTLSNRSAELQAGGEEERQETGAHCWKGQLEQIEM